MFKKKKKEIKKEEIIDAPLFEYIQTQGGITFKEPQYILTGDGYIKPLHIYALPSILDDYWLKDICNIDGTIATVDVATKNKNDVKRSINKSLQEQYAREHAANSFEEIYDAKKRQAELQRMYDEITSMGEVVKQLHFRIFVPGRTLLEAEEKADKIINDLESSDYKATVFLNEGKREFQSIFRSYSKQHEDMFNVHSHYLLSEQIAGGDPFYYSSLHDPYGNFLGFTPCGGPVIFDLFAKTSSRNYAHALYIGKMRQGKSTSLKKQFRFRAERGDYVRCFDASGEFTELTKEFGGKIIKDNEIINPLEILRAGEDDRMSYSRHISKLSTFFKCIAPAANTDLLTDFQNTIQEFYEEIGLTPGSNKIITGLNSTDYPILSDFREYVNKKLQEIIDSKEEGMKAELNKEKLKSLYDIEKYIRRCIETYGHLFNGYTSISNLTDEQIVTVNISTVKELEKPIFTAYMFLQLSLAWDNCITNGTYMKKLHDKGKIAFEDVPKFIVIADESHNYINDSMPMIVDIVSIYLRESPKFFGGFLFASHNITDYFPSGNSENLDKMKKLFALTQYKFLFCQDSSALPMIDKVFGAELTVSQREQIPLLEKGQCILAISGDRAFKMKVWLSEDYEQELFAGGN